ncbi:uncharacterized protein LOC130657067 [Hydractinia symbiolongicarpus]|uniref:uncharacterized protein LOC130657067 n=1 Tax=Hydractinia symbiolongicarpus TaxID=13093 RepID=UPI00254AD547|nr:uncharacterized protein LOC130657067 [Hydractinia symbiolongicarpus]
MLFLWNLMAIFFCKASTVKGDILRLYACNKLYGLFDAVYENVLLSNTTYSLVENIDLNHCSITCMQYPKCKSFSYMFDHSKCRIHHSTSADNGTVLQKTIGWIHYETNNNEQNLGRVCKERNPCRYGRCVDTCDSKGYRCHSKGEWIVLQRNVCFGAKAGEFGTFEIPHNGIMTGIKLVHVGGIGVTCGAIALTKWGCDFGSPPFTVENIGVVITDDQNKKLYPSMEYDKGNGFSFIPGYGANSPYVVFNAPNHAVHKRQEIRLHYGEALFGTNLDNNSGRSCADIYAKLSDE